MTTDQRCRYCGNPPGPVCDAYECIEQDNARDALAAANEAARQGVRDARKRIADRRNAPRRMIR